MPTDKYQAAIDRFACRSPVYLLELKVKGDLLPTLTETFTFSSKDSEALSSQISKNALPYILSLRGRPTKILSDQAVTERARMSIQMFDDINAPPFDSSVFSITTGSTFFRRLVLTQPDYRGSVVTVKRGFIEDGFLESDFQIIFKGRLEDIDFGETQNVTLIAKDDLIFRNIQQPSEISDGNVADATGGATITVTNGNEITDPASLPSKDYFGIMIRLIRTPNLKEEDVIIKSKTGNTLTVQDNFLVRSEDFGNGAWAKTGGITVTGNQIPSPFGGSDVADLIEFAAEGDNIQQTSSLSATSGTATFSVWIKNFGTTPTITLEIEDSGDAADKTSLQITITEDWTRYEVSHTFVAGGTSVIGRVLRDTSDSERLFLYGAQVEVGATRGFYAATEANNAGDDAGRQQFDSETLVNQSGVTFLEVLIYRSFLDDEGINPIAILRDLINRGGLTSDQIDEASFTQQLDFSQGTRFRRGRFSTDDTTIQTPRSLATFITEVRQQGLIDLWMSEEGLAKVVLNFTVNNPFIRGAVIKDEENILFQKSKYKGNGQSRVTKMFVYFDIRDLADADSPENFKSVQVSVALDVEIFSGTRAKQLHSRWIYRSLEAIAVAGRILRRFKRGARIANWTLDLKDDININVGDFVFLDSEDIQVANGTIATRGSTQFQVMQKTDKREEGRIEIEALESIGPLIAFIGPDTVGDYFDAGGTERQFAFIGDDDQDPDNSRLATGLGTAPFTLTSASYAASTRRLTQTGAFASYTHTPGDTVFITNTGSPDPVQPTFYPIGSKINNDTIELESTSHEGGLRKSSDTVSVITVNQTAIASDPARWRSGLIEGYFIL